MATPNNRRKRWPIIAAIAVAAAIGIAVSVASSSFTQNPSQATDNNGNIDQVNVSNNNSNSSMLSSTTISPIAFPANTVQYGHTYGEWTAKWWQWALSIPENTNPVADETGEHCAEGQEGPVWFLAGSFGGLVERDCIIPAGKAILFPVINGECSYVEYSDLKTEEDLRSCAISSNDSVTELTVSIDGVAISESELRDYRVQSPLFTMTLPENNIFGVQPGPTEAVSDGFWMFIPPLEPGEHEIHFKGAIVDFTTQSTNNFVTEAKYQITVTE